MIPCFNGYVNKNMRLLERCAFFVLFFTAALSTAAPALEDVASMCDVAIVSDIPCQVFSA